MQYKTIVLELLKQHPERYNQLRSTRMLLPTMDHYAGELKTSHEVWKERLSRARPGSDPNQIASEALEFALKELEDSLGSTFPPDQADQTSFEEAMAFIRRRTPPE